MARYLRTFYKSCRIASNLHHVEMPRQLCSVSTLQSELGIQQRPQDYLMQTVKEATSTTQLLDIIARHVHVMNHKHLSQALRKIYDYERQSRHPTPKDELLKNPTFTALCQGLKRHIRALDVSETVDALKFLFFLNVPADSLIYQSLLQTLKHNLNFLDIEQVMFLDFIFSKIEDKNHLIEAFKMALPLVFQIHLPIEIDADDVSQLRRMLTFACKHNIPEKYINNIVTGLLLKDNMLTTNDALSIVRSLCDVNLSGDYFQSRVKLLQICLELLARDIDLLGYEEILRNVARLRSRIVNKHAECYNELFMDAAAEYCVRKKCTFEQCILLARALSRIGHVNISLISYMCELIAETPDIISKSKPNIVLAIVNCLSNANFTAPPTIWNTIKDSISSNNIMNVKKTTLPWTKFSLELASLGIYEERLLRSLFSDEFLKSYLSRDESLLDHVQLLMLQAACEMFCDYKPRLSEALFEKAKELYPLHPSFVKLEESLKRGLGGKEYFLRNVQFQNGIVADYVICRNQDGNPHRFDIDYEPGSKLKFTDLTIPQSSNIACLLVFNRGCYSINNQRLRGLFQLVVDVLDKNGYPAIPINISQFNSMPERELAPYLMREIDFKCQELGVR